MEKLKPLLKYQFWILSSVVVLATIGVGVWSWMAAGKLIETQKSSILSAESKAQGVAKVRADVEDSAAPAVHPNQSTIEGMTKEIEVGKDEVLAGWTKLHSEQKSLLSWPGDVMDPTISRPFDVLRAEQLKFDPNSTVGEVPENSRKRIKTVFRKFMPFLVNSVRAKWSPEDVTGEAEDPIIVSGEFAKDDMEQLLLGGPLVEWALGDQIKWYNMLTNFKGRNGNKSIDGTPTTIQVVYLKENLVLLNGVLEIIKESNKNATVPSQAAIREINSIMIGKEAHEAKPLDVATISNGGDGGIASEMASRMSAMRNLMQNMLDGQNNQSATVSVSEAEILDPAHLRYIDKEFKPIPASAYRQSVSSNQLGKDSWMSVVKQVPVRLRLRVDERQIAEILEKCANAKIPLEVRQITVIGGDLPADNTTAAKSSSAFSPGDPVVAGGAGSKSLSDDEGGGGTDQGASTAGQAAAKDKTFKSPEFNSHFLVPLEIYGVMKFYSAPAPEALGRTTQSTPPSM